ncbi:MAG: bifunctional glutamate N-acetyltransferase/amino-acid acetyltransferase ArgJ [Desulfatirhabdiaceae bacterium]|nr:bifunctional glutamate N-acetyltransferase/amino-acid acetyltransferase ArgJ [Desulfatirhabdiaceae bacterium]
MNTFQCIGFQAAGVAAGLKKNGRNDLGLIASQVPATAAGVFTQNRVQAAPVVLDRERIKAGICQAVLVNSGNANCCTGEQGMRDAREMARLAASALDIPEESVLVASTGVIGQPLPVDKIQKALPALVRSLSPNGFMILAEAIMTTDTVPKVVSRKGTLDGRVFTVTGTAKGAGMIAPNMATMLCFVCTDIGADADQLHHCLYSSVEQSFNRISIDGDTSTNDTALILANGLSGAVIQTPENLAVFQEILNDVLVTLAKMLVKDGEGATKLVEICVRGAATDKDARKIADTVSGSNLVKTAIFGEDANWGRILAAAGRAGVAFEPEQMDIFFNDVLMFSQGSGRGAAVEDEVTKVLKLPEFVITIDLHSGDCWTSVWTCDFSVEYVRINADYRS